MCKICINRIEKNTKVEGFGIRYCIWVQGCSIRCEGCANQGLWEFGQAPLYSVDEIVSDILAQKDRIEGITIMGGEPMDQKSAIAQLLPRVRSKGYTIIVFTGYVYEDLKRRGDADIEVIMENVDLLIDGPFIKKLLDFSRPWIGSINQRYLFLSGRYSEQMIEKANTKLKIEIRIGTDGRIKINGMNDMNKLKRLIDIEED